MDTGWWWAFWAPSKASRGLPAPESGHFPYSEYVSSVEQHVFFFLFWIFEFYFIYFLYRSFLLVISFIRISVYMSIPISQFIPPPPTLPPLSPPWCPEQHLAAFWPKHFHSKPHTTELQLREGTKGRLRLPQSQAIAVSCWGSLSLVSRQGIHSFDLHTPTGTLLCPGRVRHPWGCSSEQES